MFIRQSQMNGSNSGGCHAVSFCNLDVLKTRVAESANFAHLLAGKFIHADCPALSFCLEGSFNKKCAQSISEAGDSLLTLVGLGYSVFRDVRSFLARVGSGAFGYNFGRYFSSSKFLDKVGNRRAAFTHSLSGFGAVLKVAFFGVMPALETCNSVFGDIETWMQRINEILFAHQQRNRIAEFKDAEHENRFAVQIPRSLQMNAVMAIASQQIKMFFLSTRQANSRTNVARLIGRTVNLVNPAYSSLSWIYGRLAHRLGFPFNLRAGRCDRTVAGISDSDSIISLLRLACSRLLLGAGASLKPARLPLFRAGLSWTTNG